MSDILYSAQGVTTFSYLYSHSFIMNVLCILHKMFVTGIPLV